MLSRATGLFKPNASKFSSSLTSKLSPYTKKTNKYLGVPTIKKRDYVYFNRGTINPDEVASFPSDFRDHGMQDPEVGKSYGYFMISTAMAGYLIVAKNLVMPILATFSASADVVALANIEMDLGTVALGDSITVMWRGKPLFIRHRTEAEIAAATEVPVNSLPDPEPDEARYRGGNPNYLVLVGVCTHLGCVPLHKEGHYNGWFCPCHGSHYDTAGRIRFGPAPKNLEVPPYFYKDDSHLLIGSNEP